MSARDCAPSHSLQEGSAQAQVASALAVQLAHIPVVLLLAAIGLLTLVSTFLDANEAPVDFTRDIAPILQHSCLECHGGTTIKGDLRLDEREGAMRGGANGPAIVPHHLEKSLLITRILGAGEDPRMPKKKPPLSAEQITLFKTWIEQGAPWPEDHAAKSVTKHWSYLPLHLAALPAVKNQAWVRNPIDRFVLARLEKEGLTPEAEADRITLIRRVSLDLIGLPPAPAEIDAFLADTSAQAYETLVDRLLGSAHFGERWARPWLDMARYADTQGYEKDRRRTQWPYRDWLIDAYNQDMPFDEFTIEQIAGDMLPNATQSQRIATGFNRNTMINEEDGVDREEMRYNSLVDRVGTTAEVWLGSTLQCAQCHNHKYDPFLQKEFYQLMAFFENADEPEIPVMSSPDDASKAEIDRRIAEIRNRMERDAPQQAKEQFVWEASAKSAIALSPWYAAGPFPGANFEEIFHKAYPPEEHITTKPAIDLTTVYPGKLGWVEHQEWADGSIVNFPLVDNVATYVYRTITLKQPLALKLSLGSDDSISVWCNGVAVLANNVHRAVAADEDHVTLALAAGTNHLLMKICNGNGGYGFYFKALIDVLPTDVANALQIPMEGRTAAQATLVRDYYHHTAPKFAELEQQLATLESQRSTHQVGTCMVMSERPSSTAPTTYMHIRGAFLAKGEQVSAGVPGALNPLAPGIIANRLALARWLASTDNPLTARVAVNRFWEQLFGKGIVVSSDDFGMKGQAPSHPELLDWLAGSFMHNQWRMKAVLRLMVTSATYRQSSHFSMSKREKDPDNILLSRGPRFRVEAEMVRDVALAASGLLTPKIGGPSVFPYQPAGIWDIPYNGDQWVNDPGPDRYRRGIYTFARRTSPYPSFTAFDAPSREVCTLKRPRTNTPLQALTVLNDPAYLEAASALARRMISEGGNTPESRCAYGYRLTCAHPPEASDLTILTGLFAREQARYAMDQASAQALAPTPLAGTSTGDLAGMIVVANALLNLDATLTKE